MNFDRQKRLVDRLLEQTRDGRLSWEEAVADDMFQVSFPSSSVQIQRTENYSDAAYQISIIDSEGRIADVFDDEQLAHSESAIRVPWRTKMGELYLSARRRALKADETIDRILAEMR